MRTLLPMTLLICLTCTVAQAEEIDGEQFVDPTRPLMLTDEGPALLDRMAGILPGSYKLTFIRASGRSPMAIVNNNTVTIGDFVGAAEVVAIDRDGVTLMINNTERRVTMYDNDIKAAVVSQ